MLANAMKSLIFLMFQN